MRGTLIEPETEERPAPATRSSGGRWQFVQQDQTPALSAFWSNLKDFLTERPVKIQGNVESGFIPEKVFQHSWWDNLKDFFHPIPAELRRETDGTMILEWKPWYWRMWQNVRDAVSPPRLPPLELTSQPVAVRELWSKDPYSKSTQTISLLVHAVVILLIVGPILHHVVQQQNAAKNAVLLTPIDISPYTAKLPKGAKKAGGGGGGGEHNPIPASRGKLPKFSTMQFTPPEVKPPLNPKLAMTPTVLGPPDLHLPSPNMANWGDPLAKTSTDSSGPGSGGGIGSGSGGGVGSGNGGGVGPGEGWGTGGGAPMAGTNGYGEISCLYCPEPQFSDDAVKVKFQGTVTLRVVVSAAGIPTGIRVIKGLGMGLDEKTVAAVRNWRFKPSTGPNGRPAAATVDIEVSFRLL